MASVDADMQKKLLSDPAVQAAVKKAGADALKNPEVQAQILKTAKEKFPEYASAAHQKAKEWANDPAVQAKAMEYAGLVGAYLGQAGEVGIGLVEQGPTGVRILAFGAGVLSCVNAVMYCLDVGHLLNFVVWIVSGYQIVFSITTMIFEAPPSVIEKIPVITGYQDMLMEKAKFLSEVLGRGLFYIFLGSLWLAFASLTKVLDLVTGCVLVFVGLLHVFMHFGKLNAVAQKMREGYQKLGAAASTPNTA